MAGKFPFADLCRVGARRIARNHSKASMRSPNTTGHLQSLDPASQPHSAGRLRRGRRRNLDGCGPSEANDAVYGGEQSGHFGRGDPGPVDLEEIVVDDRTGRRAPPSDVNRDLVVPHLFEQLGHGRRPRLCAPRRCGRDGQRPIEATPPVAGSVVDVGLGSVMVGGRGMGSRTRQKPERSPHLWPHQRCRTPRRSERR